MTVPMLKNELKSRDLKLSGRKEKLIEQLNGQEASRLQCQTGAQQDQTVLNTIVGPNNDTCSRNEFAPMARNMVDHSSGKSILTDKQRVLIENNQLGALKRKHSTMLESQSSSIALSKMIPPTTPLPSDSGYT